MGGYGQPPAGGYGQPPAGGYGQPPATGGYPAPGGYQQPPPGLSKDNRTILTIIICTPSVDIITLIALIIILIV